MSAGICSDLSLAPAGINGLRLAAKHPPLLLLRHQNEVMINERLDLEVESWYRQPTASVGSSDPNTLLLPGRPPRISSFFYLSSVHQSLSPYLSSYSLIFFLNLFSFFVTSFSSFLLFSSTSYYFHSSSTSSLFLFFSFPSFFSFSSSFYYSLVPPFTSTSSSVFFYFLLILRLLIFLLWLFLFLVLLRLQLLQLPLSSFYFFSISNLPLWIIVQLLFGSFSSTSTYECFDVILLCLLSWISLWRFFCHDQLASEQTVSGQNIVHSLTSQNFTRANAKHLPTSEPRNNICWRSVCKSLLTRLHCLQWFQETVKQDPWS